MIVLTIYCIYVSNLNYVTILKILVVLLTSINFWQMNVSQFTLGISAKKENKAELFLGIVIVADFLLNVIKIKFLLNNSFFDGNRRKSFVKP